jgi:hypothetical protein
LTVWIPGNRCPIDAMSRSASASTRPFTSLPTDDVIAAVERNLEAARYEASLAARRYEMVDPAKRHVARELETRWNGALEHVAELEARIEELSSASAARPRIDRAALLRLAQDLPAVWNAPSTDTRTRQRLIQC